MNTTFEETRQFIMSMEAMLSKSQGKPIHLKTTVTNDGRILLDIEDMALQCGKSKAEFDEFMREHH